MGDDYNVYDDVAAEADATYYEDIADVEPTESELAHMPAGQARRWDPRLGMDDRYFRSEGGMGPEDPF